MMNSCWLLTDQYNGCMDNINDFLTNLIKQGENSRLLAEHPVVAAPRVYTKSGSRKVVDIRALPLTAPSLLTRAKLSPITRRLEERRLARLERKRKLLRKGQKKARGRYHWKRKAATKARLNRKNYERTAGLGAILRLRGAKRIDQQLWDRYIGGCFREYTPKYLTVKKIKRAPGQGASAYYGNKEWPLTVYSFRVHHQTLGVVWDGEQQRKLDGVDILRIPQA